MLSDTNKKKKETKFMFTKLNVNSEIEKNGQSSNVMARQARKSIDQCYIQKQKMQILNSQIRQNDANKIIAQEKAQDIQVNPNKDMKVIQKSVTSLLNVQRKRFDEVRIVMKQKQEEIVQMKKTLDQFNTQHSALLQQETANMDEVSQLLAKMEKVKKQLESNSFTKKTMEHILERSRLDLVQYEKRSQRLVKEKKNEKMLLEREQKKDMEYVAELGQGELMLDILVGRLDANDRERLRQTQLLEEERNIQLDLDQRQLKLKQQHQAVAEQAQVDIQMASEKEWKKLLLVQSFYQHLLKQRQVKAVERFQKYSDCFQKVQVMVSVKDSNEMVQKFIKREEIYKGLRDRVIRQEGQLVKLDEEREDLLIQMMAQRGEVVIEDRNKREKIFKHQHEQKMREMMNVSEKEKNHTVILQNISEFNKRIGHKIHQMNGGIIEEMEEGFQGRWVDRGVQHTFTMNMEGVQRFLQDNLIDKQLYLNTEEKDKKDKQDRYILDESTQETLFDQKKQRKVRYYHLTGDTQEDEPDRNSYATNHNLISSNSNHNTNESLLLDHEKDENDYLSYIRIQTKNNIQNMARLSRKAQ